MSKELEALERIKEFYPQWHLYNRKDFEIIEKPLKRLKQLEEEKQSFDRQFKKELKAFKIIKKKMVDIDKLLYYLKTNACDDSVLSWYNEYSVGFDDKRTLTEKEYEILKEVLL